jgi:hypothetical protein
LESLNLKKLVLVFRRKQFKIQWLGLARPPSKNFLGYKTSLREAVLWLMGVALVALLHKLLICIMNISQNVGPNENYV